MDWRFLASTDRARVAREPLGYLDAMLYDVLGLKSPLRKISRSNPGGGPRGENEHAVHDGSCSVFRARGGVTGAAGCSAGSGRRCDRRRRPRRHYWWRGRPWRRRRGCRRGDRRHDRRGDCRGGAAPERRLLLVARRLLLPLSERQLAAGAAGLLLVLTLIAPS